MENKDLILLLNKELAIELIDKGSYERIHAQLAEYINGLIKNDFEKLVTCLYRIDVHEQKLKTLLQENPMEDAGNLIASLIIERQLQKIASRESFRNSNENSIDEKEKW